MQQLSPSVLMMRKRVASIPEHFQKAGIEIQRVRGTVPIPQTVAGGGQSAVQQFIAGHQRGQWDGIPVRRRRIRRVAARAGSRSRVVRRLRSSGRRGALLPGTVQCVLRTDQQPGQDNDGNSQCGQAGRHYPFTHAVSLCRPAPGPVPQSSAQAAEERFSSVHAAGRKKSLH